MDAKGKSTEVDGRKARLAEALRQNLARRKAQARSRRNGEADSRREGIPGNDPAAGGPRQG